MTRKTSKAFKDACTYLKISEVPEESGIALGDGTIKTDRGYIRTPKSRMSSEQKEQQVQHVKEVRNTIKKQPEDKPFLEYEEVIFSTELGNMKGFYYPVVVSGDYIILGLSDNSFVPKSYKEAPQLRFSIEAKGNSYTVIFTGCRWRDPETNREQIILMQVKE